MPFSYEHGYGELDELAFFEELELGPEFENEITGTSDSRSPIRNTTKAPYRWICRLLITWSGAGRLGLLQNVGTGILIGAKHVLTAAHNLHSRENGRAQHVTVDPGRDRQVLPFGSANMARFEVPPLWTNTFDSCSDYGLITLDTEIGNRRFQGKPLGYWGSPEHGEGTSLGPFPSPLLELKKKTLHMVGYPKDKCEYLAIREYVRGARCQFEQAPRGKIAAGGPDDRQYQAVNTCLGGGSWARRATAQFGAKGRALEVEARGATQLLIHDIDSCEGQSGGPVWLESGRSRYLLAVHTGSFGTRGNCSDPGLGGFSERNRAVLMSTEVRRKLIEWKSRP
jgi:V8-like Glu-specific endopeptidase